MNSRASFYFVENGLQKVIRIIQFLDNDGFRQMYNINLLHPCFEFYVSFENTIFRSL